MKKKSQHQMEKKLILITTLIVFIIGCACEEKKQDVLSSNLEKKSVTSTTQTNSTITKSLTGKDAIKKLQSTTSFADDFRSNNKSFFIRVDQFASDTNEFHFIRTMRLDKNKKEHTITSYRINSKSGLVHKKNLSNNKWKVIQ